MSKPTGTPCPAATIIQPADDVSSVLCGVLAKSNDVSDVGGYASRGAVSPVMSGTRDPNVVRFFCRSPGIPGSRRSYCACALWRAQRDAELAGRHGKDALRDGQAERVATAGGASMQQRVAGALQTLGR